MEWREKALDQHPHQAVATHGWILPNDTITALSKIHASDILRGPEIVSLVADHMEEWVSTYALDIHSIIARFDEEKRARKLCKSLSCRMMKKVRSMAWQDHIRTRYEQEAELALIIAESAVGDIARFEEATKWERKLSVLDGIMADEIDEMKRMADVRRSELHWLLGNAVRNLEKRCESFKEAVVWSSSLAEEEDAKDSAKVTVYLPPPVRRSSRQSM